ADDQAEGIRQGARDEAERIVQEADDQAEGLRRQAEALLSRREAEAGVEVRKMIEAARVEAGCGTEGPEAARRRLAKGNHARAMELVDQAVVTRERILADLARRRRVAIAQIEQLRAGRERLLDAYRVVRRTLDQVTDELQRADAEARAAASADAAQ